VKKEPPTVKRQDIFGFRMKCEDTSQRGRRSTHGRWKGRSVDGLAIRITCIPKKNGATKNPPKDLETELDVPPAGRPPVKIKEREERVRRGGGWRQQASTYCRKRLQGTTRLTLRSPLRGRGKKEGLTF